MTPPAPRQGIETRSPANLTLLLQQARAGNQQALAEIYSAMFPRVIGLVRQ
jgi:hypothetical protein